MQISFNLRARLLGTSAIAAGSMMFGIGSAVAVPAPNCTGLPLTDGATIVCTGTSYYSITDNADDATVTLNADAELVAYYASAIQITGDDNVVTLQSGSLAYSLAGEDTIFFYGDNNTATLNDGAGVIWRGDNGPTSYSYIGLGAEGDGNTLTLNGGSFVHLYNVSETTDRKYMGIMAYGNSNVVTLNGESAVLLTRSGRNESAMIGIGIASDADGADEVSSLTLNGGSQVTLYGSSDAESSYAFGVIASSYGDFGATVELNGGSTINVYAEGGLSNKYIGLVSSGQNNAITLNSGSSINLSNSLGDGGKYVGILDLSIAEAPDEVTTISLNGGSSVNLSGSNSTEAKYVGIGSIGGGGSKYVADITLTNSNVTLNHSGGTDNKYIGLVQIGTYGAITMNGGSSVSLNLENVASNTKYSSGIGVAQIGYYASFVMNGTSSVTLNAVGELPVAGVAQSNDYASIVMNDDTLISLNFDGAKYAVGISQNGYGTSLTLNDNAAILLSGNAYSSSAGVTLYGDSQTLTLNDYASIDMTDVAGARGIYMGGSFDNRITLNGHSSITAAEGIGILSVGGMYSEINIGTNATVSGDAGIYTHDDFGTINISGTIDADSLAVGVGGDNNTLTLNSARIDGGLISYGAYNSLNLMGSGTLDGGVVDFYDLNVNASGIWTLNNAANAVTTVTINSGTLAVNGALYASSGMTIEKGGTLGGSGTIYGSITNYGTISPGNSPGTLNIVGSTSFAAGSTFLVEVAGGAADLLNVSGAPGTVTIAPGAILQPQFLSGVDGFSGDIITATGGITGTFIIGSGGAVVYTAGVVSLTATSSSSMNGGVGAASSAGFSFLDTVMRQAGAGAETGKTLWATAIIDQSDRTGQGTSIGYNQRSSGGAFGGTLMQSGAATIGLAGGYLDTSAQTVTGSSETNIDGFHVAAYGTYNFAGTELTAAIAGAYQDQDVTRKVLSGGAITQANGSPEAWSGGAGFGIAHPVALEKGFTLTPRANLSWLHVNRDGYTETGGGTAAMSLNEISTDTMRGLVGAELSLMVKDPNALWSVRPNISAGLAQEWRGGDSTANGTFTATGGAFSAQLDNRDQTYLAVGAGVDVVVGTGLTAFASYDGGFGGDAERSGGFRLGARLDW